MLTNKKIDLFQSNRSHYQMMSSIQSQWKEWQKQKPIIFISYNGHAFDEELIRGSFGITYLDTQQIQMEMEVFNAYVS